MILRMHRSRLSSRPQSQVKKCYQGSNTSNFMSPTSKPRFFSFISSHFRPDPEEMKKVLAALESKHRVKENGEGTVEVEVCRFCRKPNKEQPDNLWKLYINPNGSFRCFRCSVNGSWYNLKKIVTTDSKLSCVASNSLNDTGPIAEPTAQVMKVLPKIGPPPVTIRLFNHSNEHNEHTLNAAKVLSYLNDTRGLNNIVLMRYGVGMALQQFQNSQGKWENQLCVTFPWMLPSSSKPSGMEEGSQTATGDHTEGTDAVLAGGENEIPLVESFETVRVKYRALATKGLQRILPKGGPWGFFGWQLVMPHHKAVIITEGEYDAMAVAQALMMLQPDDDDEVIDDVVTAAMAKRPPAATAVVAAMVDDSNSIHGEVIDSSNNTTTKLKLPKATKTRKTKGASEPVPYDLPALQAKYRHLADVPAISLPNGCNSLPPDLIVMLERFDKIYLWLDNDQSGREAAEKFANKLGLKRCVVVKPDPTILPSPPKDANDALRAQGEASWTLIPQLLDEAAMLDHERIQSFDFFRSAVINLIRKKVDREGSQSPSLPRLSEICKGFRAGELVVFTGPTGAGKTTLLSQLSLDFVKQGAPTLWASFEILNVKLIEKMMRQFYPNGDLRLIEKERLDAIADDFSDLPLYFMNFYGASDIDLILEAMDFAVYRDDVKHIILDNLQFMLPRSIGGKVFRGGFEKFDLQDIAIEKFRKFATEKKVNIILVVHPRKETESSILDISSVFGTAKATQEADVVLILQGRKGRFTSLDVKKNRYDGQVGNLFIEYRSPVHKFIEAVDQNAAESEVRNHDAQYRSSFYGNNNGNNNGNARKVNGNYYHTASSQGNGASIPKAKATPKIKAVKEPKTIKKSKAKSNEVLEVKNGSNDAVLTEVGIVNTPADSVSSSTSSTTTTSPPSTTTSPESSLKKSKTPKTSGPTTAWMEYCHAERERIVKDAGTGVKVKKPTLAVLAPKWQALSDAEKKVYNDLAKIKNSKNKDNHSDTETTETTVASKKKKTK